MRILGFSELLQNDEITDSERDEYAYYVAHNSRTLLKVMDNIIDLTFLETDNLELKVEEVLVEDLFREIFEFYNAKVVRTMHYRVALLMTTPAQYEEITIQADGFRLKRIIDNLVNNAITRQMKGVIEMRLDVKDEERVVFTVISKKNELLEERAKKIFENNGSMDDWHNHLDATGLAYKLARDMAKAMGGFVSLVEVDDKRMGVSVEMPVKCIGYGKKKGSLENASMQLN